MHSNFEIIDILSKHCLVYLENKIVALGGNDILSRITSAKVPISSAEDIDRIQYMVPFNINKFTNPEEAMKEFAPFLDKMAKKLVELLEDNNKIVFYSLPMEEPFISFSPRSVNAGISIRMVYGMSLFKNSPDVRIECAFSLIKSEKDEKEISYLLKKMNTTPLLEEEKEVLLKLLSCEWFSTTEQRGATDA